MNIESLLMREIGVDVNDLGNLIDQDFNNDIQYKGKNIKYSQTGPVSIGKLDILLDINDTKLIISLFSYYLDKLNKMEGLYFPIYFPNTSTDGRTSLTIKSDTGVFMSESYYNESLKYVDIIFRIGGTILDLSKYDIVQ